MYSYFVCIFRVRSFLFDFQVRVLVALVTVFFYRMEERVVLRFQWMDIEQDLIVYDKDRETLLDLILDLGG